MRVMQWSGLAVVALSVLSAAASAEPVTYNIDPAHSSVGFSVKHLVISNVKGSFGDFSGTITLDKADMANSGVEVSITAASIDTANEDRDKHLRGADFFDVEKHPSITFKSTEVKKGKAKDAYVAVGNLTMRGVAKKIELPFTLSGPVTDPWGNEKIGAQASTKLNRQDYGVSWSKIMDNGGLVVGDEVTVNLEIEAGKPQ